MSDAMVRLRDICTIKGRIGYRGYTKQDLVEKGQGAISLSPSNIIGDKLSYEKSTYISWPKYEESPEIMVYPGDIVFCKTASVGKTALVEGLPEKATLNPQLVVLKGISCFNKFLYYYLLSDAFKEEVRGITGGTAVPTLSQESLGKIEVPLPSDSEQQRVVGKLDAAFAALAEAQAHVERNRANARELFESYLNGVFEDVAQNTEEVPLGALCQFVRGPFGGSLKKSFFVPKGYAVYEQSHAIYDQFEEVRYFIDEDKFAEMKRFELRTGDLIMSCSGTMGRVAIVPEGIKRGVINQALLKLTPSTKLTAEYLKRWMESEAFHEALNRDAGGAAIQNVASVSTLKEIRIPLPGKAEQERIVAKLKELNSETDSLEATYQQKLSELAGLKKAVLGAAFRGEL